MKKKLFVLFLAFAMVFAFAACGGGGGSDEGTGSVYWLNMKPEADEALQGLAAAYTEETGVPCKVVTAASGSYSDTQTAEMAKSEPPTLFNVGNMSALKDWEDYCLTLDGTDFMNELTTTDFNLKNEAGETKAIGWIYESYGIITNKALLEKAGHSLDEIKDFDSLKAVADDIHARAGELGFDAFTSAGLDDSSSWRFSGHLANMPLFYEFRDDGIVDKPAEIKGTYMDNFKKIWDLYITDSATDPALLSTKTGTDAETEFIDGKAVFFQNGTWEYDAVKAIGDENLAWTPIYIGAEGEENQGVCTGTENYLCVNGNAEEADIQATLDFLEWVVTSEEGTDALANKMNFVSPFKKAKEASNTLVKLANEMVAAGKSPVSWNFPTMPSEQWKNDVGSALTAYAASPSDDTWEAVRVAFVDGWAKEYAAKK